MEACIRIFSGRSTSVSPAEGRRRAASQKAQTLDEVAHDVRLADSASDDVDRMAGGDDGDPSTGRAGAHQPRRLGENCAGVTARAQLDSDLLAFCLHNG